MTEFYLSDVVSNQEQYKRCSCLNVLKKESGKCPECSGTDFSPIGMSPEDIKETKGLIKMFGDMEFNGAIV